MYKIIGVTQTKSGQNIGVIQSTVWKYSDHTTNYIGLLIWYITSEISSSGFLEDFLGVNLLSQRSLHSAKSQYTKNLTGCFTRYTTTSVAIIFMKSTEIYTSAQGNSVALKVTILLEFSIMFMGTIMSTLMRKKIIMLNSLARKFLQI